MTGRKPISVETSLEYAGRTWIVLGEVWLGTTPPNGPDPTAAEWRVVGGSDAALLDAIYQETELTRLECDELIQQACIDAAREPWV